MEEIDPDNIIGGRTRGKVIDWSEAEQKSKDAGDELGDDDDEDDDEDFVDPDDEMKDWEDAAEAPILDRSDSAATVIDYLHDWGDKQMSAYKWAHTSDRAGTAQHCLEARKLLGNDSWIREADITPASALCVW